MWDILIKDLDGSYGLKVRYYEMNKKRRNATGFAIGFHPKRLRFHADIAYRVVEFGLPQFNFGIGRSY